MNFDPSQLRPDAVSAYLASNEWRDGGVDVGSDGLPIARLWEKGGLEIAVPLRADYRDYRRRLSEAIEVLRRAEGRDAMDVASDLVHSGYDVIRVRIMSNLAEEGVLPLESAAEYVVRAKEMLMASACSVVSPKIYFASRKPTQANDYIRRVKFGQTQRGSFVFSLMAPIAPRLSDLSGTSSDKDSFERRVTRTLLDAVLHVKVAAAEAATTQSVDLFEQGRAQGVSANLCSALAGLSGDDEGEHDVELGFTFALVNPADVPSQRQLLHRSFAPILRSAAAALKAKAPIDEFELDGLVLELKRDEGAEVGSVVVLARIDGQARRVALDLQSSDYASAVLAHQRQSAFGATGTLVKEGKSFRLKGVRDVREV